MGELCFSYTACIDTEKKLFAIFMTNNKVLSCHENFCLRKIDMMSVFFLSRVNTDFVSGENSNCIATKSLIYHPIQVSTDGF